MEPAATQIVSSESQSRNNLLSRGFLPTDFVEIEPRESNSVPIRSYPSASRSGNVSNRRGHENSENS
jgi:hypothetical protein